eukprot:5652408-Alexandrium_andersonii.AAC.1
MPSRRVRLASWRPCARAVRRRVWWRVPRREARRRGRADGCGSLVRHLLRGRICRWNFGG